MDVLRTIMDEIECVVSKVEKEEIDRVVNLIRKDRRIFVAGEGRSGFSAKGFAMRLMHLGYTVYGRAIFSSGCPVQERVSAL